jgi:threonine synthase
VANEKLQLAAVNSINWARILAQITYYFSSYFQLVKNGTLSKDNELRFVVPTGNFGDILAGYFAKRMGLPIAKLVIATNENDILHRFWQTGAYEKNATPANGASNGNGEVLHAADSGVKETLSPAMDILVSSNFERLLWFLAHDQYGFGNAAAKRRIASEHVREWLQQLKDENGFRVDATILEAARSDFDSERVSDQQTVSTIRSEHDRMVKHGSFYVVDPHTAIGLTAAQRSAEQNPPPKTVHVSLATAHPAKFSQAVEMALAGRGDDFDFNTKVLPKEFQGLLELERRVTPVRRHDSWAGVRKIVIAEVEAELEALYGGQ